MKIWAVVPIRLNNERFPNKNPELLGRKSLCTYLLNTLASLPRIETYVYCSDFKILSYLPENIRFFRSNAALDQYLVKRQETVLSVLQGIYADIYAHVATPFLMQTVIQAAVNPIVEEDYDNAIDVVQHKKYA